jgi:hypothetical protein
LCTEASILRVIIDRLPKYKCVLNVVIPKPVWAVGFALEQTLHVVTLAVFSFLILKRLQHKLTVFTKPLTIFLKK